MIFQENVLQSGVWWILISISSLHHFGFAVPDGFFQGFLKLVLVELVKSVMCIAPRGPWVGFCVGKQNPSSSVTLKKVKGESLFKQQILYLKGQYKVSV